MKLSRSPGPKPKLAVVVLNWNGWEDTLECLDSLVNSRYRHHKIVVVDNGSSDDSLARIRLWAGGEIRMPVGLVGDRQREGEITLIEYDQSDIVEGNHDVDRFLPTDDSCVALIKNETNLGFAGGNNVGIRFALNCGFDKILLLNNDTSIDPECLAVLSDFLDKNDDYDVVTPKINYYDPRDLIWNCGGKLTFFGSRKYFCKNQRDDGSRNGIRDISFITGCALMARTAIFRRYGLLSERFFLGEEDYEFSLRMRMHRVKMAAVERAKVYHKISASKRMIFGDAVLPSAFIFYLNRFVDLKDYYSRIKWKIWRLGSVIYIVPMLKIRHKIPFGKIARFVVILFAYSNRRNSVTREDFFRAKTLFSDA